MHYSVVTICLQSVSATMTDEQPKHFWMHHGMNLTCMLQTSMVTYSEGGDTKSGLEADHNGASIMHRES